MSLGSCFVRSLGIWGKMVMHVGSQCYAFLGKIKVEYLYVVVTSIVSICHNLGYVLFNPDSIFFYLYAYFVSSLDIMYESSYITIYVDTQYIIL